MTEHRVDAYEAMNEAVEMRLIPAHQKLLGTAEHRLLSIDMPSEPGMKPSPNWNLWYCSCGDWGDRWDGAEDAADAKTTDEIVDEFKLHVASASRGWPQAVAKA